VSRRYPHRRTPVRLAAEQLLRDGRVRLTRLGTHTLAAVVHGHDAVRDCGWRDGRWWCTCPRRSGACAHLTALRLIVAAPRCACCSRSSAARDEE
jgi:uncharacterized Zn finger protein